MTGNLPSFGEVGTDGSSVVLLLASNRAWTHGFSWFLAAMPKKWVQKIVKFWWNLMKSVAAVEVKFHNASSMPFMDLQDVHLLEAEILILQKLDIVTSLRIFQHTPGTNPRPRIPFHLAVLGMPGVYTPGLSWGFPVSSPQAPAPAQHHVFYAATGAVGPCKWPCRWA